MLILRWNERSRRAAERQGFELAGAHGDFDLLVREATVPGTDSQA